MAKPILNSEQKEAFKAIQRFIEHPAANTFVLKGYAGTGKTFLMQHLAKWLEEKDYKFSLLASTGRAATVLRGKTGFEAKTVHSELYNFSKVNGDEEDLPDDAPTEKFGQMTLQFSLRQPDDSDSKKIYIIDESSMLSSELQSDTSTVAFGSGFLLVDFFEAVGRNKIIFVGDPGQLPPVGQIFSPALNMDWLAKQQRIAVSITLKKIERQDADNDLLILASVIRNLNPDIRYPKLPASKMNNVKIYPSDKDLFNAYRERFGKVGSSETLA
jgi:ATP-dependent exoDNAse (exonuclease V) alpha subunit